ncbi:hypothetical protein HU762_17820 [Pseudomonas sp. SWRI92]|uniref:hypothetical protein n=1 Tax=Pseudomonas sp. SWRI92 TaxID=2745499 RepID=UPI001646C146|nr:hypothetical protein [Pseudomonas sp. SWRI92]MBC3375812.1 hypothetical protein [Pseudomonas sp. SWRI92]
MSKQTILLGTPPTGVGGDTPRSAFTKAQSNFDELYTALGAAGSPVALPAALPITKGGTGGTTQAAARIALGLKSAAVADIVGPVSQSGGVPTGALIERGSNANGQFVKYADGTLICWGSGSGNVDTAVSTLYGTTSGTLYSTVVVVPLPFSFVSTTTYGTWCKSNDRGLAELTVNKTASQFGVQLRHQTTGNLVNFDFLAIGRWF